MIYLIADTHGDIDRLKKLRLKKSDFLIICGDFGFIWSGDKKEKRLLKRLGRRRYPILFVDGVHENFKLLEQYPVEEYNGGKTHLISGNLRHLMRGQVFRLGDKTVLALGGGVFGEDESFIDEDNRRLAMPCNGERLETMENLKKYGKKVDYVVSYEAPSKITEFLELPVADRDHINAYLDEADHEIEFKRWFFGKHHMNKIITQKYCAVFDKSVKCESSGNAGTPDKIHKTERKII